jgi:fluoroquinolone transport system permease protein
MLRRSILAARLVLAVQTRAYFPHIYLAIAVLTVAALRFLIPEEAAFVLLPIFLVSEQGVVAMVLVGAHIYLERNEGSTAALAVTPLRSSEYLVALVFGSSVFACVSGAVIWAGVVGLDMRVALLMPPLLLLSVFSGLVGVGLTSRFGEFTGFLMGGAVTGTMILSLPFLSYLAVTPRWSFAWLPSDWALNAFAALLSSEPSLVRWCVYSVVLGLFCLAAFLVVLRRYRAHRAHWGLGWGVVS